MRPNMNKYLHNDKWLCNMDVRQGARVLATILFVLFLLKLVLDSYFTYWTHGTKFILWTVYEVIAIVACILVLFAERFKKAWFYLPLIMLLFITAFTALFYAIVGLISMLVDGQSSKYAIYNLIPYEVLKNEEKKGSFSVQKVHEDTEKTLSFFTYLLFILASIGFSYVCWVNSRAYYQMKHIAEFIPYVTKNYRNPRAVPVETTSYSPQPEVNKPLIVNQTTPKDMVPVACKDLMEIV
uniref:MARVEL domain-containing protein n=1 Tax=Panagrolaimus sp. JU765 TaxID=591449 RepID=A0AC34QAC0_9BILA